MAELLPFRALRYDEQVAGPLAGLICPPYDVIGEDQRVELRQRSPNNLVRVELPQEEPDADRYAVARHLVASWRDQGVLRADAAPALFVSEHFFRRDGRPTMRRGLYGALRLTAIEAGEVRPHERTFPKAKADRLSLLRATRVNTSPVFGMVSGGGGQLDRILDAWMAEYLMKQVGEVDHGEEGHRLWAVDDQRAIARVQRLLANETVYIADGHHRYETALAYMAEAEDPRGADTVLVHLCTLDDPGLWIRPTHRLIQGAALAVEAAIQAAFDSRTVPSPDPAAPLRELVIVDRTEARRLRVLPSATGGLPRAWQELPVGQAELIVATARGAGAAISYEHDTALAIEEAMLGNAMALLVPPVTPQDLQKVADAGERLPEKTTYFYPKVPAGLVLRALDD